MDQNAISLGALDVERERLLDFLPTGLAADCFAYAFRPANKNRVCVEVVNVDEDNVDVFMRRRTHK